MIEKLEMEIVKNEQRLERIKKQIKMYAESILRDDSMHDILNTMESMNKYTNDIKEVEGEIKALERAIKIIEFSK